MLKATLKFYDGTYFDLEPLGNDSIPSLFTRVLNMLYVVVDLVEVDVIQNGETIRQYTKVGETIDSYDLRHRTIKEWKIT